MRMAIATENGSVSAHFGHCEKFTLVDIENGTKGKLIELDCPPHECAALPQLLGENGVQVVIAGGIGMRPQQLFASKGIKVIAGISGSIDDVIELYVAGKLNAGENFCGHDHGDHPHGKCNHDHKL